MSIEATIAKIVALPIGLFYAIPIVIKFCIQLFANPKQFLSWSVRELPPKSLQNFEGIKHGYAKLKVGLIFVSKRSDISSTNKIIKMFNINTIYTESGITETCGDSTNMYLNLRSHQRSNLNISSWVELPNVLLYRKWWRNALVSNEDLRIPRTTLPQMTSNACSNPKSDDNISLIGVLFLSARDALFGLTWLIQNVNSSFC